jgi:hypothetical protein
VRREEVQSACCECLVEVAHEHATEHPRQHPNRQKEPWPASYPAVPTGCDATAGNQTVQMRVVHQVLIPRVQHGQEANLGAQMLRIGADGA